MSNAGTPCPVDGKIGQEAKDIWEKNPERQPSQVNESSNEDFWKKISAGLLGILILLAIL